MKRRACLVLSLGLAQAVSACKARENAGADVKDLNPGTGMNSMPDPASAMKDGRKVVVIYYANDTYAVRGDDPARVNLEKLTQLIQQTAEGEADQDESQRLSGIATRLQSEWEKFRDTVSEDIGVLSKRLCQTVVPSYQESLAGFVVFRNFTNDDTINPGSDFASRTIRKLKFSVCRPDNSSKSEGYAFEVPRISDFPYLSQPLSHPLIFQKALESVRTIFPPSRHRYILITKSHGSEEIAMAPNLSVDLTTAIDGGEGERIMDAIRKHRSIGGLDPLKQNDPILADMDETLREAKAPPMTIGVTKGDYISILRDLGTGGNNQVMNFPIVLMESCRSDLRFSSDQDLSWVLTTMGGQTTGEAATTSAPDYRAFNMLNIGWVYTSDRKGLAYKAVRYSDLNLTRFQMTSDFQDAFKSFLDSLVKK